MNESIDKIAVGLCADIEQAPVGLDVDGLRRQVADAAPEVSVEVVADLCRQPERAAELASHSGAKRLVLGLCSRESATHEFQSRVRKAGLDPFALELVTLGQRTGDPDGALALLRAAIARQRLFAGSRPEQLRARFLSQEWKLSRRSLFTLPPLTYEAVPSIDRTSCVGALGCNLCTPVCPTGAIECIDGQLALDKTGCIVCGLCVTACPVGAIEFPGSSLVQFEAELEALLTARRPIVVACRGSANRLDHGNGGSPAWLPLEVPCLGMVTSGWILQALVGGAPAVGLLSCGGACRCNSQPLIEGRVAYVQELLRLIGDSSPSERVTILAPDEREIQRGPDEPLRSAPAPASFTLREPVATAAGVLELFDRNGEAGDLSLKHEASPLGVVTVNEETCTCCGTCAAACPTGALVTQEVADAGDQVQVLSYDATLCLACGRCADNCPEAAQGTLTVGSVTDTAALVEGRVALKRSPVAFCRTCGGEIASTAMLDRIRVLLQDEEQADKLLETVGELCNDCRGSAIHPIHVG